MLGGPGNEKLIALSDYKQVVSRVLNVPEQSFDIAEDAFERAYAKAECIVHGWGLNEVETRKILAEGDVERVSYVLGIYKALKFLFPMEQQAAA